jgi:AbrB family looped-hinge helix DNA binding protein
MEVTLDRFGRVVIPKSLRIDLGLSSGSVLEVEEVEDGILLKPARETSQVEDRGGVLVFVGKREGDVTEAVRIQRELRFRSVSGPKSRRR